jgi:hypothetical protein
MFTGARAPCLAYVNILVIGAIGIFVEECRGGCGAGGAFIAG